MRQLLAFSAVLPLACGVLPACAIARNTGPTPNAQVWVRSHNASEVDLYLLCGDRDARWLGRIPQKGDAAFEMGPAQTRCVWDLNFFLVVRNMGRGYWVGPIRPQPGRQVELVIEKYAGLSAAQVRR